MLLSRNIKELNDLIENTKNKLENLNGNSYFTNGLNELDIQTIIEIIEPKLLEQKMRLPTELKYLLHSIFKNLFIPNYQKVV